MRTAIVDNARDVVAIDRQADGVAERCGTKPFSFPFGQRASGRFVEPDGFRVDGGPEGMRRAGFLLFNAVESGWLKFRDDLGFTAQKALELDVLVLLNIDANGIEIRQFLAAGVTLP